jgi:hypothetical protein
MIVFGAEYSGFMSSFGLAINEIPEEIPATALPAFDFRISTTQAHGP